MKFAKQKFSIFLLFFALPIVFGFALIENDFVSSWLLRGALRFVRIRTGVQVEAASWSVNPILFSASLHDVEVRDHALTLDAKSVSAQISPLSLMLGKVALTFAEVNSASLKSTANLFHEHAATTESAAPKKHDVPVIIGREYQGLLNELRDRNISFEELRLVDMELHTKDLSIAKFSLGLSNLGSGQARASWEISGIELVGKTSSIADFHGAIALLQRSGGRYSLSVGNIGLEIDDQKSLSLTALGGYPGVLNVKSEVNFDELQKWIANSPYLKDKIPDDLRGHAAISASAELGASDKIPANMKITGTHLVGSGMKLHSLETSISFPDIITFGQTPQLEVERGRAVFVETFGSNPHWKKEVDFGGLRLDQGVIAGSVKLSEVGLCSLLVSLGEKECFAGVGINGTIQLQGNIDPVGVRASLDLGILPGPIASSTLVPNDDSLILTVKPNQIKGTVQVKDDRLHLDSLQVIFDGSSPVDIAGDINYTPTQVHLKARSGALNIASITDEVVGLKFGGVVDVESDIFYDHNLPKTNRTRVIDKIRANKFSVEGESFGSVSGNLDYVEKSLRFGPFQVRNGGGVGKLSGGLVPRDRGNFLDLELNVDRLEYTSSLDSSGKPYFTGFLTGGARMSGYPGKTDDTGLSADIEIVARNFQAFDIPFQKANLSGTYKKKALHIDSFRAIKDGAWLELSGDLNPQGGSQIKFWSDKVPLKNIGIDPGLAIFDSGKVEVQGKWQPSIGWSMNGQLTEMRLGGQVLPVGQMKIVSEKKTFEVGVDVSTLLKFEMRSNEESGRRKFDFMEVNLKDRGLYAGFAYLGKWTEVKPFTTSGSLAFRWAPRDGYFKTQDLVVQGPVGTTGRILDLVSVPGKQSLVWKDRKIVENSLAWSGPSQVTVSGRTGESQLAIRGKILAPFVGLFVPGLTLSDGYLEGQANVPLSPDFETLQLRGNIVDASVLVPGLSEPLTSVKGRVLMQQDQIQFQDVTGSAGAGTVQISGLYKLDPKKSGAALQIELQQARSVVLDDIPIEATGALSLTGEMPPYVLGGRLSVANALYSKEFQKEKKVAPATAIKKTPFVKFDLDLDVGPSCRVVNSLIASSVTGDLRIAGTEQVPLVSGEIDLKDGSIFANQNEFHISFGRVYIPQDPAARISLNLSAQTSIKYSSQTYRIDMNARGPVDNLEIDLTSDPVLARQDIISLLAFGVIRDVDNNTQLTDPQLFSAAQAEAFQSFFGKALGSSINKSTGFQVTLKPGVAQQLGNETLPNVNVVRKLSDKVTASFGRSLDLRNPEKNFQVDYQLMKNLNLTGVWENESATGNLEENQTSMGVDLRFRIDVK